MKKTACACLLALLFSAGCGGGSNDTNGVSGSTQTTATSQFRLEGDWYGYFPGTTLSTPVSDREGFEVLLRTNRQPHGHLLTRQAGAAHRLAFALPSVEDLGANRVRLTLTQPHQQSADEVHVFEGTFDGPDAISGTYRNLRSGASFPMSLNRSAGVVSSRREAISQAVAAPYYSYFINAKDANGQQYEFNYGLGYFSQAGQGVNLPGTWTPAGSSPTLGGLTAGGASVFEGSSAYPDVLLVFLLASDMSYSVGDLLFSVPDFMGATTTAIQIPTNPQDDSYAGELNSGPAGFVPGILQYLTIVPTGKPTDAYNNPAYSLSGSPTASATVLGVSYSNLFPGQVAFLHALGF